MNLTPLQNALNERFPNATQHQQQALDALLAGGFPDRTVERWKYTRATPYVDFALRAFAEAETPSSNDTRIQQNLEQWQIAFKAVYALVIIDGKLDPNHSKVPAGVTLTDATTAPHSFNATPDDAMALLNDALPTTRIDLTIAAGTRVETPLHIVHLADASRVLSQVRITLNAEQDSELVIAEHVLAATGEEHMHSSVVTAHLDHAARLHWYRLQNTNADALIATRIDATLDEHAALHALTLDIGGALVRNDLNVRLNAPGAHVTMNGVYLTDGKQHVDNHTQVNHVARDTTSSEDYRGVLREHSRGVFNGKVYVHEGADGTDAAQSNKNLLLSDHAEIDTKPELEIYADDVKCAHGATVGQLDDASVFYLRSRGIDHDTATQLLTFAFCRELIKDIADPTLREAAQTMIADEIPNFTAMDIE
ncbi:MAG: Fe-S cluster assembly protein SufD [Pseudomonadota bacterium]